MTGRRGCDTKKVTSPEVDEVAPGFLAMMAGSDDRFPFWGVQGAFFFSEANGL